MHCVRVCVRVGAIVCVCVFEAGLQCIIVYDDYCGLCKCGYIPHPLEASVHVCIYLECI